MFMGMVRKADAGDDGSHRRAGFVASKKLDREAVVGSSVIVAGARTPMGRLLGSLKDFSGAQLGG